MHRARSARQRMGRRGFGLVEVVIATTLLAIGIVGVAGAMAYAAKVSRLGEDQLIAANLVADLLAEARAQPFTSLSSWYTYPGDTGTTGMEQAFSQRLGQSRLAQSQAWLTVTDLSADLKGVSVIITWGTGSPRGSAEAGTLVSARF